MGDLVSSILGGAKYTTQTTTPDPLQQQMNVLRYNELQQMANQVSPWQLYGEPQWVPSAYTADPRVGDLYNQAQGYLSGLGGYQQGLQQNVVNQVLGNIPGIQGVGQQLAGYPGQFAGLGQEMGQYPQQMQQIAASMQPYAGYAGELTKQMWDTQQKMADYSQAYNQYLGNIVAGAGRPGGGGGPSGGGGGGYGGGGAGAGFSPGPGAGMTLDQYKAMGTTGLGDYVKQILGPQLTQGYAAEGLAGSGAAQEALAKGTAQVAEDFIKTLPAAAEQLGMLPYQQGLAASQGGLYGAQAGLAGAQAGLAGAQASHIGAMTPYEQALMGAQTGMQQAQMGLLGMQPLMQQYAMQQGALAPLQAAANFQLAQLEPWQAAYQATAGQLAPMQAGYQATLGQLQPWQAMNQAALGLVSPYQTMGTLGLQGSQAAQGLMPMVDYQRSLYEQNLMRQQQMALTGLTGIPYSPGSVQTGAQRQPPLFGFFGYG